jgi:hypothetical protein
VKQYNSVPWECLGAEKHLKLTIEREKERERERERERELKGFDRERNAHKKPLLEILWCDDYQDSFNGVWNSGTA